MSLILDALNRSRQDVGDVPGLDSQHQAPEVGASRNNRWWFVALVLALVVIAFLLVERRGESDPPAPQVAPAAPERVLAPKPALPAPHTQAVNRPVVPAARPEPPRPAPAENAEGGQDAAVAALYSANPAPDVAKPPPAKDAPATAPTGAAPTPDKDQPGKPGKTTPAVQRRDSEQPVDIEAIVRQAQGELENALLDEHPAPFLASLSQQTKDGIPTIFYERHDYSGKPGQSAVVLNGKALKPGGKTSAGVRVDEILPDSVVLSYRGVQFRLRALNSWVNL